MASQRPIRDILRRDYHAMINYKDDKPTHPPTHPLVTAVIDPAIDLVINPLLDPLLNPLLSATRLETLDNTIVIEPIPTTVATNTEPIFNSNIYNDLDNGSNSLITPTTSIQPLESTSQVPLRVPRLQAKSRP